MSLSWLESRFGTMTLRLGRDGVCIEPQGGAISGGAGQAGAGAQDPAAASQGQHSWQWALNALERLLQADATLHRAKRVRLVLANEFVRYTLLPWQNEALSDTERQQLARALLAERYGERESQWQLALEPQCFGKPALAAAVDADLIEALRSLTATHGRRLISMVPALVDELNRHRRQLGKVKGGWLVDASDARLASLAFAGDAWAQVGNERYAGFAGALKEMLLPLLRRDTLRMPDLAGATVFVANYSGSEMPGLIDQVWPVVRLEGPWSCA